MSASTWGGSEPTTNEAYPAVALKHLLKHMMVHFAAHGACLALLDESIGQMRIQAHLRWRTGKVSVAASGPEHENVPSPISPRLRMNAQPGKTSLSAFASGKLPSPRQANEEIEDVTAQQNELFAVGSTYPLGHDLIGYAWHKNEAFMMRHEDYLTFFHSGRPLPYQPAITPTSYLVVPISTATLLTSPESKKRAPDILGVILLYRSSPDKTGFQDKQRIEALHSVERVALYLQNDRLQRAQRRTSEYLQLLQEISTAFPTSVQLSKLVEKIYEFVSRVVDVSSMLLTLYDRDTDRLYDVFAVRNGERIEGLDEQPVVQLKEERPQWWTTTQKQRCTLLLAPAQDAVKANEYQELLTGTWGDQRDAESFLLLPMKMFNRVIGALCLTSLHPHAYHQEEIQVLETMTQIVTVNIENAKLYERDRQLLQEARQREAKLAAINSALQSISSELNMDELLKNLVKSVAMVLGVEMCVFFQPSPDNKELVAHALHAPTSVYMFDDGSGMPEVDPPPSDGLISMIRLPFKGTFLEEMVNQGFFYLDQSQVDELAQKCDEEGGAIFLRETQIHNMLIIPMFYQTEFVGCLAVPVPKELRFFRPKDTATLLAICAQATSAIRNAQLFDQREEAYAELQRMDKLKDEFMVTASHELRTPLSAISGYSTLLKRQGARATPQQIMRFATKIASAAQQLTYLVANMTEAAKAGSAADKELHIEPVQVYSAAEIAASILGLDVEQEIALDIAPDLWFRGDGNRVRQVLTNLLENAAKYSPPNGRIVVSARAMPLSQTETLLSEDQVDHELLLEQGEMPVVLVRVRDQGEGILPQDQQRIFEKFVRAQRSLTTPVRGSGLGLYICRRFIEAMNGKIWLEQSIPNEGSTFSFYLPLVEPPVDPQSD